jgi:predicted amidohydrolase
MFKVGFFQFAPRFGQVKENLSTVVDFLAGAEADLIVLPELPFTGYLFENRAELTGLAESPKASATLDALSELCAKNGFSLVTGFAEKTDGRVFNSAVLLGPPGILHIYRKLHLFNTEKEYFDPGDTALRVQEIRGVKVGMMVCFDWAFPEVSRVLALQGAEVICHPSNLVLTFCQETMRARCIENGLYAVTCNRCGTERRPRGELAFSGQSQVVGPRGEVMLRAASDQNELAVVEIDVKKARDKSITERNDLLSDRRPEFYRDLVAPSCKA